MPLYEYRCPTCRATFELLRPMSRSGDAASCPKRHRGATRTISLVAALAHGRGATESSSGGCACGNGSCGCGH